MRELITVLEFTSHSLGNVGKSMRIADARTHYYAMPKTPAGAVSFLPKWWKSNLEFSAKVLSRHQDEAKKVCFDHIVDGEPRPIPAQLFRRFYEASNFTLHEAYYPGDIVSVTAVVPDKISESDFHELMALGGKYKGISPFKPYEYGFYAVKEVLRK